MTIINKYKPLNDEGKIKSLIEELKGIKGAMNLKTRQEIFTNIQKTKLQIMFQEKYPETMFNEEGNYIPNVIEKHTESSVKTSDFETIDYLPNETLKEKKSVYGTYIEMAFHNFFLTMQHIYTLVFGKDLMQDAREFYDKNNKNPERAFDYDFACEWAVWRPMFNKFINARPEQKEKFEELIIKHFPFLQALNVIEGNRRKTTRLDALKQLSFVMRELRNIYSHYKFRPFQNQIGSYKDNIPFIFDLMDALYIGAKREVKTRFGYDDNKMKCAEKYEQNKDHSLCDRYGKQLKIIPKKNFRYTLYRIKDKEKIITPFGLLFLTSLFLEKKYAKIFSDKTHHINNNDCDVMCELISIYRIRLHIPKLSITKSTDALALDIINELQRCPKSLYEILPTSEQQKFRIKSTSSNDPEVLMIRQKDRFAHLLLKYIDDTKRFDSIRFQVSLGRYFFRFYDKHCIDSTGDKRVRSIYKDVHGFGRLSDIESYRKEFYKDKLREYEDVHQNTSDEKPYITDHHARYIINNNKIGIYIRKQDDHQNILQELTPDGVRNVVPTCWLSTYELPALAFLLYLYNDDGTRIEEIIIKQVTQYQRLFSDIKDAKVCPVTNETELQTILNNYENIKISNLPRKMLDYLLSKDVHTQEIFHKWAEFELQKMIKETERLLQNIKDDKDISSNLKLNKFGKKSFVAIKPGKIADFLAHDMMYFQPYTESNKNKLTGLNFRILQSVMAVYNGDFNELSRILRNAHIIGDAKDELCNPIVMGVCRKHKDFKDIIDFYIAYLEERKKYLQQCLSSGKYESLSFLHSSQIKWKERDRKYYRSLAARYLEDEYGGVTSTKAIELPRGMFEPYIRKELREIEAMKDLADDPSKNISYLIYGYFKNVMNEDTQTFYDAKRCYQLFNVLYRKSPRDEKVYYNTSEIREMLMRNNPKSIRKDIVNYLLKTTALDRQKEEERCNALLKKMKNIETELKKYKIQDILLFLFAKKILIYTEGEDKSVIFNAINNIHLKDITKGDTLSQKIPIKVSVESKNGYKKTLTQDDLKLKNYSQFYSIINDRRLPALLDLVKSNTIKRKDLEDEFKNYDKAHPNVLQSVFEYEKYYYDTHDINTEEEIPNLNNMLNETDMSWENIKEITSIRNSFAHYSYPKYHDSDAAKTELPKKAETLSNKLINDLKNEKSN